MDRRNLDTVRIVARLGSVTAAASELSMTQPAVSKQITKLESELSVRLFHRRQGGMVLTAAGETLIQLGSDVLTRFERLEDTMRSRHAGARTLRIACPHTTALALLAPFMADADPAVADLLIVEASEVDGMLERGADMAISSLAPPPTRARRVVADIPVTIQGTSDLLEHRFGEARTGDLERVGPTPVIVARTGVRVAVTAAVAESSPPLTVRTVSTGSVAQALAANGHGFALATEQPSFDLRSLPAQASGRAVTSPIYASWEPDHYAAPELRALASEFSAWIESASEWATAGGPTGL